ncbi:unnamed protein product [Closterium sp. NIES-54]
MTIIRNPAADPSISAAFQYAAITFAGSTSIGVAVALFSALISSETSFTSSFNYLLFLALSQPTFYSSSAFVCASRFENSQNPQPSRSLPPFHTSRLYSVLCFWCLPFFFVT